MCIPILNCSIALPIAHHILFAIAYKLCACRSGCGNLIKPVFTRKSLYSDRYFILMNKVLQSHVFSFLNLICCSITQCFLRISVESTTKMRIIAYSPLRNYINKLHHSHILEAMALFDLVCI